MKEPFILDSNTRQWKGSATATGNGGSSGLDSGVRAKAATNAWLGQSRRQHELPTLGQSGAPARVRAASGR